MPKKSLFSIIIITLLFLLSCNSKQDQQISSALSLSDDYPDSALTILKSIDKKTLNDKDLARYALIFTKSQDKSGIDVDNDSLIGIAYDWYKDNEDDSLYASCFYYQGKCFMLNGDDEQALECFEDSKRKANGSGTS